MALRTVGDGMILQGRYRVEERIAAGGMGVVYAAIDERLDRRVALKLPSEGWAQNSFVERFRREAHAVAALAHPNIAAVYDYGEEDGRPFIVMELIEGLDLARVLRRDGPLSPESATWIAIQVCAALGCAHSRGIVHRDIKPANIMVCQEPDRVKVTDFGIARATGDATLTGTGGLFGTADYISPEQASGQRATPLSDQYSLGIVLYEMLTGAPPFASETAMASVMRRMNEDVPPPSQVRSEVSQELDEVVSRATAREPRSRFRDAGEVLEALRGTLEPGSGIAQMAATINRPQPPPDSGTATVSLRATRTRPITAAWALDGTRGMLDRARSQLGPLLVAVGIVIVTLLLLATGGSNESAFVPNDPREQEDRGTAPAEGSKSLTEELNDLEKVVAP